MDDDSFTLAYELFVSGPGPRIEAVHRELDGTLIGDVFKVHDSPPAARNPAIDGNGTSRYVVAYDVTTPPRIFGRLYVNETVTASSTTSTTLMSALCGDADGNGSTTASDALRVLNEAVGLDGMPNCPPCA